MHRRLLALTRVTRLPLLAVILSGLLTGLLTIWQAWLLSHVINAVFLERQSLEQVERPLVLMLFIIGGRALLAWLNEIFANAIAVKVKTDLRQRIFTHILRLGPAYARGQRTGELTTAIVEGIEALDVYFSQYLPQLVITILVPLSILIFVLPIDLLSGIIFFITAPLIPLFMILIGKGAEVVTQRQYDTLRLLSAHFLDSLQGLTTLKLFGQSKEQARVIARVSDRLRDTTLGVLRLTFLSALALELLATISTAIIAVEIGFRLLYGKMDFQPALFLLVLAPEFYMPLRALGARFHAGMSGTTAAKRIYEILDTPIPASSDSPQVSSVQAGEDGFSINFEKVSYTYPSETVAALEDVNLTIPAGQHIAFVGKTGAGKSTLAGLLLGFIRPTSGKITVAHGSPISSNELRKSIAWVPQRPYLFHDTIAANLCLGKADATYEEIVAAAQAARLHEFIEALPQGYETVIGEGGARLSSGQAQRLALARAFLKDAPILLLDEPTSSLDPETEALLDESTRGLIQGCGSCGGRRRTVITIAHRLNTVFQADQIIVLDAGRVVEQGTHFELIAKNGLYANMVKTHGKKVTHNALPALSDHKPSTTHTQSRVVDCKAGISTYQSKIDDSQSQILLRLLSFLRGSWHLIALSVLLGVGTVLSSVALMGTSAWLISNAALYSSVADLGVSVVGVRFFGIARGLLRYSERLVSHNVTFRLLARLRVWFYEKVEPLAPACLTDFRAGDLLARIVGDLETLENFYVRVVAPPLTATFVGLFTAFFLASFYSILAPVFLIYFLSLGLILPILAQLLSRKPASQSIAVRAALNTWLVDSIQGMADLLAYGRDDERLKQISALSLDYGNAQHCLARIAGFHSGFSTLLSHLGLWTVLFLCIPQVASGHLAGPMLASLTLLTFASFEAVTPLPFAAQMWIASREAARRLFEVVDTKPAVSDYLSTLNDRRSYAPEQLAGTHYELQFVDLSFSYPNQSFPALQDINFAVPEGKSLAIVGPSGAGKSTLVNLLLRFWDYCLGEIYFRGRPLKMYPADDVRAQIGLVSQNAYFFNASIRENLRLARRKVTQDEIEYAARAAQIHDFIVSLPNGYDTLIGEQGLRLSGGERQRLAIARALIKDAPILILDEPTANLDPLTEQQVLDTLFRLMQQKTSLLITHRLIGLENVDEIIVMDQGRVVERGTHDVLIKSNGLYRRLWDLQHRMLYELPIHSPA